MTGDAMEDATFGLTSDTMGGAVTDTKSNTFGSKVRIHGMSHHVML